MSRKVHFFTKFLVHYKTRAQTFWAKKSKLLVQPKSNAPMPHFMIKPRARTSKSLDLGVCQCRSITLTISLGYFIINKNNQKGGNNICILVMDVLLMGEQVYHLQVGFGSSWVNAGRNFYNSLSYTEKAKKNAILISPGNS